MRHTENGFEGGILDVSALSIGTLDRLDASVIETELRELLDRERAEVRTAGFNSVIDVPRGRAEAGDGGR